ncbi:hypothetical protein K431DRAFT_214885 [Polychaeton citri CBS 116435]|uniref:Phosphatidylserine decarboxylase proenzyme 2 n=1 Tax=Polychaeton citri CBS 116435 TaxID=1314669 RepID=A0A9P4QEM1_9PEZI|nr:hypothetical protein K431DRAFT_214885 [Polychaeton citri CBS 116435]
MPRPHLPTHLSLHRVKSGTSTATVSNTGISTNGSRAASPTLANGSTSTTNGSIKSAGGERGDHANMGLVLRVQVVKGRNLAAKDKSGTSDPFLVLTLGDAKQATSVIGKTLNPEWNQTFELPVTTSDSALLEAVCWDKDRFRNDYMGEFDVILEDMFTGSATAPEPRWFKLESRRSSRKKKKKDSDVTGDVLLKFTLYDPLNLGATSQQILQKFHGVVAGSPEEDEDDEAILAQIGSREDLASDIDNISELDEDDLDAGDDTSDVGSAALNKEDKKSQRRRKAKIKRLKRKSKLKAYEFSGMSDVAGVLFLEVNSITDLPPEKNMTRTSFDMDPFVVVSLGKKTYRTRVVRHNLNPVFDEKLVFQVQKYEVNYSLNFAVVDRDKFSGNDYVGTANFPIDKIKKLSPEADPETGLYRLPDIPDSETASGTAEDERSRRKRFRIPMSRSASQSNMGRLSRTTSQTDLSRTTSNPNLNKIASNPSAALNTHRPMPTSAPSQISVLNLDGAGHSTGDTAVHGPGAFDGTNGHDDPDLLAYQIPLELKKKERWEDKHNPTLYIKAKYLPYQALRQQFWRAMLKQYDADESGKIDKIELTTMLDTLGSTLHNSTIDGFFSRWKRQNDGEEVLTMDQAVISLEEQLMKSAEVRKDMHSPHWRAKLNRGMLNVNGGSSPEYSPGGNTPYLAPADQANKADSQRQVPVLEVSDLSDQGERGDMLPQDDLADDDEFDDGLNDDPESKEEHVVEIKECPICHQPRLSHSGKKGRNTDADIITHIATCASSDWRAVNNLVMAGFVTSSQAQRKWYSKVITKVSYGGYKLGANSANILVQDRTTGMINEERMSVYVRLGIRLLYKGLKSNRMEKKQAKKLLKSMSLKQGRKFDDPASASQIPGFINFHQLDMSEVLHPTESFRNFNEFFYRELKPEARPCSAPENPHIVVAAADCRSVVFNRMEDAQRIWVKGRDFSIERLLGDAYPQDAKRYHNGGLAIMRLAPQDYHRFHIPVDGIMGEPKLIEGEYYTVNPMAIRSALDVYGENIRVIVPIDSEVHGRVMVICVGAMMVGSTVITRKAGDSVKRAEELGYFKFGGSTVLILFEPGRVSFDDDLAGNSNGALETLIRVGMSIGHSPEHAPHAPDMKKANPSHEEKQEARRKIEGSLAPSTGLSDALQFQ